MTKNFLHISTFTKIYPFGGSDKQALKTASENKVSGRCIALTKKTVSDKVLSCDSVNKCKPTVQNDASQDSPNSMCQAVDYTQGEISSLNGNFERPPPPSKRT